MKLHLLLLWIDSLPILVNVKSCFSDKCPDLLKFRLRELILIKPENLYVSIDWHSSGRRQILEGVLKQYMEEWLSNLSFDYRLHKSNQGLGVHLTETMVTVLIFAKAVIVIQGDLSIVTDSIGHATNHLLKENFLEDFSSISVYSVVRLPKCLE